MGEMITLLTSCQLFHVKKNFINLPNYLFTALIIVIQVRTVSVHLQAAIPVFARIYKQLIILFCQGQQNLGGGVLELTICFQAVEILQDMYKCMSAYRTYGVVIAFADPAMLG